MSTDTIQDRSPVWGRITNIVADHGAGSCLYDTAGRRYLDFTCGIGVTNTGHCHPRSWRPSRTRPAGCSTARSTSSTTSPCWIWSRSCNRGATRTGQLLLHQQRGGSVEGAVKLAKHATGRPNVIVFQGSFHGRTHLTMAMTTSQDRVPGGLPAAGARHFRSALSLRLPLRLGRGRHHRLLPGRAGAPAEQPDRAGRDRLPS